MSMYDQKDDYQRSIVFFWCTLIDGELVFGLLAADWVNHSKQRNCIFIFGERGVGFSRVKV